MDEKYVFLYCLLGDLFVELYNVKSRGSQLHTCLHCNYSSPSVANVRRHMIIHSGERPYACNVCDFRCNQKENLKRHYKLKHMFIPKKL